MIEALPEMADVFVSSSHATFGHSPFEDITTAGPD
jgi:hypothetical protein